MRLLAFLFEPEMKWLFVQYSQVKFMAQRISKRHEQRSCTRILSARSNCYSQFFCHLRLVFRAEELYVGYCRLKSFAEFRFMNWTTACASLQPSVCFDQILDLYFSAFVLDITLCIESMTN